MIISLSGCIRVIMTGEALRRRPGGLPVTGLKGVWARARASTSLKQQQISTGLKQRQQTQVDPLLGGPAVFKFTGSDESRREVSLPLTVSAARRGGCQCTKMMTAYILSVTRMPVVYIMGAPAPHGLTGTAM